MAGPSEQRELDLIGKVELRIALVDTDIKLESTLRTYLPPLLLKLSSESKSVRDKVISVCQHINTRVKSPSVKLPVHALLRQFKENRNPLVRHFDLLYIQQGVGRLTVSEHFELLPTLVVGLDANYKDSTTNAATLFNLLLQLLHSLILPARGSTEDTALRKTFGFIEHTEDADFVASWLGKLILFNPKRVGSRYWALSVQECDFLDLNGKKDIWQPEASGLNLVHTKIKAGQFLASGAFEDAERFLPALFASADPNSRLSDIGDDMLKRAGSSVSLEDPGLVNKLFEVYLGTRGTEGSLPAQVQLQTKILSMLCKSRTSSSFVAQSIQLVREGLLPGKDQDGIEASHPTKHGLEAAKLRGQILAYTNWLARISSSTDIKSFAPALVGQIRNYIEVQGWPRCGLNGTASATGLNSRRSGYETIGLLAAACPHQLLLEPDLDLLRWLLNSLSGDNSGKDTSISIEQALSSVIGAFAAPLSGEIEASLTNLLLYHAGLHIGDVRGSNDQVFRSTRFVAVRFANRCLPFRNTTARYIDILALNGDSNESNEVFEEGSKGLDPYWHAILNGHKSHISSTDLQHVAGDSYIHWLPDFSTLVARLYDQDKIQSNGVSNFRAAAKDAAAAFCRSILIHQALTSEQMTPVIDADWERKLGSLTANDGKARQAIRSYFEKKAPSGLERFLEALFDVQSAGAGPITSQRAGTLLEMLSLVPDRLIALLAPKSLLIVNAIFSNDKVLRTAASNIFGILGSHPQLASRSVKSVLTVFDGKCTMWESAIGVNVLEAHGALLALAFYVSRMFYRGRSSEVKETLERLLQISLDITSVSHDSLLLEGAAAAISELSAFGAVIVDSRPAPNDFSSLLQNLKQLGKAGDEKAIVSLGYIAMHYSGGRIPINQLFNRVPSQTSALPTSDSIVDILYSLHEVRQAEVQFAVGAALSCAAAGWESTYMVNKLDVHTSIKGVEAKTETSVPADRLGKVTRFEQLDRILERVLIDCTTTKPALRQACVIWLLCLVQYCGQIQNVQRRLKDYQVAFRGYLSDRDSVSRETAARGLGLVYEKGDRQTKDDLVRELIGSFTGTKTGLSGNVSEETELFEPGALPTGDNQSITTYKDIMSLAAEVGDPSLVYKFMSMAANNSIWTSRAAFGHFGLSNILSDSSVDGYLAQNPKLYPALFRYRFDPNPNVRSSMNELWRQLVKEPSTMIDRNFDSIIDDLLKNIINREWRVRQASCAAIADLVQGRPLEKYEKHLNQIWTVTYKVCDDVKGSVREAAQSLARVLAGILTRSLEAESTSTRNVDAMLKVVLPFLFSTSGLESSSKEIQVFSLSTLLDIIKASSGKILRPYVPNIVGQLIGLLSSFEHEGINYLHLNADKYGVTTQQIDSARLTGVSQSPLMEAIERCLDYLDASSMIEFGVILENAIKSAVGLPSKVGSSKILVSLSTRHNYIFKSHADNFLKLTRKQLLDRNDTISSAYATACGYIARLASNAEILQLLQYCQKLFFDSDDDRHRAIAGNVVYALSKHATDRFNGLAAEILPFVFVAQHDPLESAAALYKKAWDENVGGSRAVLLYLQDIIHLAIKYLDSPRWSIKHTSAFAIADSVQSMGSEIDQPNSEILWPAMERAISGKTWEGKERVLKAFVRFAKISKIATTNKQVAAQMQKIMLRESKRNNPDYRQEAIACLGEFVESRTDLDLFADVLEITRPVIVEAQDRSSEMDVDSPSGRTSSRYTNELSVAHALSSLLRSINPQLKTVEDLTTALRQTFDLISKATEESGSRIIQEEVYNAEKDVFTNLGTIVINESLENALIVYAQRLSHSANEVEQSRFKAAEVGTALCLLARKGSRLSTVLRQQLGQLQAQERSVPIQQCLERAVKSLDV